MIWHDRPFKPTPRQPLPRVPHDANSHDSKLSDPELAGSVPFSVLGDPKTKASDGIAGPAYTGRRRRPAKWGPDKKSDRRREAELDGPHEGSPEAACLAELRQHFDVLAKLLRPYYAKPNSPLDETQRHDICRLIIEMDALLREVEAALILYEEKSRR